MWPLSAWKKGVCAPWPWPFSQENKNRFYRMLMLFEGHPVTESGNTAGFREGELAFLLRMLTTSNQGLWEMRSTHGVKFGADADFLGWGLWAGTLWLSQMRIKDANTGPALKQEGQDGAACHWPCHFCLWLEHSLSSWEHYRRNFHELIDLSLFQKPGKGWISIRTGVGIASHWLVSLRLWSLLLSRVGGIWFGRWHQAVVIHSSNHLLVSVSLIFIKA